MSKFAYGISVNKSYQPENAEHFKRKYTVYEDATGSMRIPNIFSIILQNVVDDLLLHLRNSSLRRTMAKNTKVSESEEFRHRYSRSRFNRSDVELLEVPVLCYHGNSEERLMFMDRDPNMYSTLCTIEADLSELSLPLRYSKDKRKQFYRAHFSVVLCLGLTELMAQVAWVENGVEKRSPAKIVYNLENDHDGLMKRVF